MFHYLIFIVPRGGIGPEGTVLVFVGFFTYSNMALVIETNSKAK